MRDKLLVPGIVAMFLIATFLSACSAGESRAAATPSQAPEPEPTLAPWDYVMLLAILDVLPCEPEMDSDGFWIQVIGAGTRGEGWTLKSSISGALGEGIEVSPEFVLPFGSRDRYLAARTAPGVGTWLETDAYSPLPIEKSCGDGTRWEVVEPQNAPSRGEVSVRVVRDE